MARSEFQGRSGGNVAARGSQARAKISVFQRKSGGRCWSEPGQPCARMGARLLNAQLWRAETQTQTVTRPDGTHRLTRARRRGFIETNILRRPYHHVNAPSGYTTCSLPWWRRARPDATRDTHTAPPAAPAARATPVAAARDPPRAGRSRLPEPPPATPPSSQQDDEADRRRRVGGGQHAQREYQSVADRFHSMEVASH